MATIEKGSFEIRRDGTVLELRAIAQPAGAVFLSANELRALGLTIEKTCVDLQPLGGFRLGVVGDGLRIQPVGDVAPRSTLAIESLLPLGLVSVAWDERARSGVNPRALDGEDHEGRRMRAAIGRSAAVLVAFQQAARARSCDPVIRLSLPDESVEAIPFRLFRGRLVSPEARAIAIAIHGEACRQHAVHLVVSEGVFGCSHFFVATGEGGARRGEVASANPIAEEIALEVGLAIEKLEAFIRKHAGQVRIFPAALSCPRDPDTRLQRFEYCAPEGFELSLRVERCPKCGHREEAIRPDMAELPRELLERFLSADLLERLLVPRETEASASEAE